MPQIEGQKFVIVGGASLLGSNIGKQLLENGAGEVVLMDNLSLGNQRSIEDLVAHHHCHFLRGDMLRMNELVEPFRNAAGVFNVAGFLGGPMLANPWMGLDVNVRGLQNVLEASRIMGVEKVIFSSSLGVYGKISDNPCTEDSPFDWNGVGPALALYSGSKIVGEGLCKLYYETHGLEYAALRYSNLYGENQHKRAIDGTRIVNAWAQIRQGDPPTIEGNGENVTDFVYIGDVARANLLAMEATTSGAYNIASGRDTTFNELMGYLLKACGSPLRPVHQIDEAKVANPVVKSLNVSIEKAKRELGWEPLVNIEEGLKRLVKWLDEAAKSGQI